MKKTKKDEIIKSINAWSGPLVAGIVIVIIALALFVQGQPPAGQRKKARVRVATQGMVPVAASSADSWNGGASSPQSGNSIIF